MRDSVTVRVPELRPFEGALKGRHIYLRSNLPPDEVFAHEGAAAFIAGELAFIRITTPDPIERLTKITAWRIQNALAGFDRRLAAALAELSPIERRIVDRFGIFDEEVSDARI